MAGTKKPATRDTAAKTAKTTMPVKETAPKKTSPAPTDAPAKNVNEDITASATETKPAKSAKSKTAADAPEAATAKTGSKATSKGDKKEDTPSVKTNVKTSVKYDPDFTRSVLDASGAPPEPMAMNNRYNDSDLAEFRELINRKLESAKKELAYLQGVITRKDEGGGDNDARYMTMEDGSLSMEREQLSQMASRQITYIDHLEKALIRIENKTYGICRVTGKLIDKARLRVVPHATLSVEAKMGKVK